MCIVSNNLLVSSKLAWINRNKICVICSGGSKFLGVKQGAEVRFKEENYEVLKGQAKV